MKFQLIFVIAMLGLASTTQGFLLKSAIKKKLPAILPSIKGLASSLAQSTGLLASGSTTIQTGTSQIVSSSSGSLPSLVGLQQTDASIGSLTSLSAPIPPTVTLYAYPTQRQVIYRSIRPVVQRTVYTQAPSNNFRGVQDIISNLIPNPIDTLKSAIGIGNAFRVPAIVPQALPVPISQVYYAGY